MKKQVAVIMAAVMVLGAALVGCGTQKEEKTTAAAETTTEEVTEAEITEAETVPEETFRAVGGESADAVMLNLTNKTGADITEIMVKNTDSENWSENLLSGADSWKQGETVTVFFAKKIFEERKGTEAQAEKEETSAGSEMAAGTEESGTEEMETAETGSEEAGPRLAVLETFDLGIVLKGGGRYTLSSFPFQDMKEGEIWVEEEVAFVVYESLEAGGNVNTKDQELALKKRRDQEEAEALLAESRAVEESKAEEERERQEEEAAERAREQAAEERAEQARREAEAAEQARREAEAAEQARREAEAAAAAAAAAAAPAEQEEEGCLR